jgi:hypothetical protein
VGGLTQLPDRIFRRRAKDAVLVLSLGFSRSMLRANSLRKSIRVFIPELLQLNPVKITPRISAGVGVKRGADGRFREVRDVRDCFRGL